MDEPSGGSFSRWPVNRKPVVHNRARGRKSPRENRITHRFNGLPNYIFSLMQNSHDDFFPVINLVLTCGRDMPGVPKDIGRRNCGKRKAIGIRQPQSAGLPDPSPGTVDGSYFFNSAHVLWEIGRKA
ncbi:MAG: hypothetical protein J0H71_01250 [Rhizobiales bacterium]|nr:hypothetical protein [Hyphomicrobiales bacterium]